MAKKFTKLTIGDIAQTIGSRVFKKLITEQPVVEDELQGTWVFDFEKGIDFSYYNNLNSGVDNWEVVYKCGIIWNSQQDAEYDTLRIRRIWSKPNYPYNELDFNYFKVYQRYVDDKKEPSFNYGGVFTITSKLSEVTNGAELLTWLKANATKQSASTPNLITFTIAGTSYQAEEGMTWGEWYASDYNTTSYYIIDLESNLPSGEYIVLDDGSTHVKSTEKIVGGYQYKLKYLEHSGGSN